MSHFREGLFAKYSAEGDLQEIYGDFDLLERFGSPRMLQITMNGGTLRRLPDRNLGYFYGYQPRVIIFTPSGDKIREMELNMPWHGQGRVNPFRSEQFGWAARSLVESVTLVENGFLIASNG